MDCQQLVDKITKRIRVAYSKHLSYAGRLQIIMAVLFSMYNFWGAVFILPQSVLKEIDKRCRELLWGATEGKRKLALVKWTKVCVPKKYGGLNIKGCCNWNIASVGKLLWQLARKKDILWVKWVNGIYMKTNRNIWEHIPPVDCSWYWKKLNSLKAQMTCWYQEGRYTLTPTGSYSVSQSYQALLGTMPKMQEADLIWNVIMLSKQRIIVWLAYQERLLTRERLIHLNIPIDTNQCCLCEEDKEETQLHLFAECSWISEVGSRLSSWLGITIQCKGVYSTLQWIKRRWWKQFQKEIIASVWGAMIYYTWQSRNYRILKHKSVQPEYTSIQIQKEMLQNTKRAHRCQNLILKLV